MHHRLVNLKVMHYKLFNRFINLLLQIWTTSSIVIHHQFQRRSGASQAHELEGDAL